MKLYFKMISIDGPAGAGKSSIFLDIQMVIVLNGCLNLRA